MAPRKIHKCLSIKDKLIILNQLQRGISGKSLATQYGIDKSTISHLKKNEAKIRRFSARAESGPGKRRTLKSAELPKMEKALYQWFLKQRKHHIPISAFLLAEKAKKLNEKFKECTNFTASSGWVDNFKKRHGIRLLKICGEKLSNKPENVKEFIDSFHTKVEEKGLTLDQCYNADESALFWKLLPDKTLAHFKETKAPGRKTSKERITFMVCSNASGNHKLQLLVIGKSRNPRAFKNMTSNPVQYRSTKNAWMTGEIFKSWFHDTFVPQVRKFMESRSLAKSAILLLDNAPSHPKAEELISDDGLIVTMFLPPNCTALIQPMDQNAINLTKLYYKKALLSRIIETGSDDVEKAVKNLTLKDAIIILSKSWDKLQSGTLKKCWNRILKPADGFTSEDDLPLQTLKLQMQSARSYQASIITLLNQVTPGETFDDDEVRNWLLEKDVVHIEDDSLDDNGSDQNVEAETINTTRVKDEEAIQIFDKGLQWAMQNSAPLDKIEALRELRNMAINKTSQRSFKQVQIDTFFQKN